MNMVKKQSSENHKSVSLYFLSFMVYIQLKIVLHMLKHLFQTFSCNSTVEFMQLEKLIDKEASDHTKRTEKKNFFEIIVIILM